MLRSGLWALQRSVVDLSICDESARLLITFSRSADLKNGLRYFLVKSMKLIAEHLTNFASRSRIAAKSNLCVNSFILCRVIISNHLQRHCLSISLNDNNVNAVLPMSIKRNIALTCCR